MEIAIISIEFIGVATLLGNPVRRFLFRIENVELFNRAEVNWILSLTTGIALLTLILLWLGLYPGLIIPSSTWVLSFVALTVNVIIYRKQLLQWRDFIRRFRGLPKFKGRWFIVLFLLILAVQMSPLVGLWVTPGDDAKLYSLISLRIVESQGIPRDWGAFASPSWYTEYTHLLLPGFSSEVAFLHILFGVSIPSGVSVLTGLLRSLSASTLYVLVWTMTRRRMPSVLAMATYGLMIVEPTFGWFAWGGMAELAAISVLPIAATGTYLLAMRGASWQMTLWTALLVGGMSLLHPFAFFYYLAFMVAVSLVLVLKRRFLRGISVWLPMVLSLVLGSGPILSALSQELSVSALYSTVNPAWTPTLNRSMSVPQALFSLGSRFVTVYGVASTTILIIGLSGLVVASRGFFQSHRKVVGVLSLWYLLMFMLHENNPNGLFVIPFPLWYRIDSNRTFGVTSLIIAGSIGLIGEYWIRSLISGRPFTHVLHLRNLSLLTKGNRKNFAIAGLLLFLVSVQVGANTNVTFGSRSASPVTADDVTAFDWIITHTPPNATFFVNLADAGSWIPVYTERRVVMPFGVVTNVPLLVNYTQVVSRFAADPGSTESLQFLTSLGVTYVYLGPARIYNRSGFDPIPLLADDAHFTLAYHDNAVWIFRFE